MKRILFSLAALCLLLAAPAYGFSHTSARASILLDADSGRVLHSENADAPMLIASTTKIMTALVALENCPLDRAYTVTAEDMAEGSSMYLKIGEQLTLRELLYGLMLSSGNDAALAVAHCVAGETEDFVALMNQKAAELGLENTSFANPNGLDHEAHYASARDLAVLAAKALENKAFQTIVSTKSITLGTRTLTNHNKLLSSLEGCIGVKTGYTKAAGRTLVSAAERNGQTLVAVTLNDGNDWQDHKTLINEGFRTYPNTICLSKGDAVGEIAVKYGAKKKLPLVAAEEFVWPLCAGETPQIDYEGLTAVAAPVVSGTAVGEAVITLNGTEIGRVPVVLGEGTGLPPTE